MLIIGVHRIIAPYHVRHCEVPTPTPPALVGVNSLGYRISIPPLTTEESAL